MVSDAIVGGTKLLGRVVVMWPWFPKHPGLGECLNWKRLPYMG